MVFCQTPSKFYFLFFDIDLLFPRIRALQATFKAVLIAVYMNKLASSKLRLSETMPTESDNW